MKKLHSLVKHIPIHHLQLESFQQNSRIEFVMNTLCEWYGWTWAYSKISVESKADLALSYGVVNTCTSCAHLTDLFPLMEIGKPGTHPVWGTYEELPNPCDGDPVAGMFYLLTCAEEYTITQKDQHSRVRAHDLSVVKQGYGSIPLADRLAEVLAKAVWQAAGLKGKPEMKPEKGYSSLDIDQVYAVHHKSWYRKVGNLARTILAREWSASRMLGNAILGARDPFDQFDWIASIHEEKQLKPFVFLLMGYENATDPAWNPGHSQWPALIAHLNSWSQIGLHPSYRTSTDPELLEEEKTRLEGLIKHSIRKSRQHYLKISWPQTFQSLITSGIKADYSIAWPDWLGFRMGTARSCFWYDLSKEEQTGLRLYPPAMMEVTGRNYLGLSPKQFLDKAKQLRLEAKQSQSGLRIIWHNSNLSEVGGWKAWKGIYPQVLDLISD